MTIDTPTTDPKAPETRALETKARTSEQIIQRAGIELTPLPPATPSAPRLASPPMPKEVNGYTQYTDSHTYLSGWRLYTLTAGLCLSLLLSTLETTIVSTALVSITNALHGFEERDWIVTSYLLTYTGFLVIYAKFSDVFGMKFMILLALLIFTVFSIACGVVRGMSELIILRAFQGIGGSGIYSMVSVITAASIPPAKFGKYMAIISSVFAVSSVLGPVLGGAITDHASWRWVFLLNAPGGALATALIILCLPSDFSPPSTSTSTSSNLLSRLLSRLTLASFRRLDLLGAGLILIASILVVYALEEANTRFPWKSVATILPLVVGVGAWFAFVGWEVWLGRKEQVIGDEGERGKGGAEPIFPMRLLRSRVLCGMLLNAFFTGFPFTTLVVSLPQRSQAMSSTSPTRAGLLLLPLLLTAPFASGVAGLLISNPKLRVPPLYLITLGSILQFLGTALLCTLPTTPFTTSPTQYVFETIAGIGFGLVLTSLLTLIPLVVEKKDMPVVIGAITQVRVLGGTIGLAISTTVLNGFVKRELRGILSGEEMAMAGDSLGSIGGLDYARQLMVREVLARGFRKVLFVTSGFSGCVLLCCGIMWERKAKRLIIETGEGAENGRMVVGE